jgi:glutamate synthase domain-containing protein 2
VRLGPRAARPLDLAIPMYVSGMAYGLALSREARLALAYGARAAGTALNSGQGPYLEEERAIAPRYILQFGRWAWNREPHVLAAADMIEVQVGQGAMPGNAVLSHPSTLSPELRRLLGLRPGEEPVIHARLFLRSPEEPASLAEVVRYLRDVRPGIPVAVKFGAGDRLEADLDAALEAEVDVVVVDGTEGATGNAPITLSDHFGLPLMVAVARARRHLDRRGVGRSVSLVASGGLREPGEFLKALALGADALALGTAPMIAVAHAQIGDVLPYYPPTALVFYQDRPAHRLDPRRGGESLANYFESCRREMAIALRAMGLRSVRELSPEHLSTLDPEVAAMTGVHLAFGEREQEALRR